MLIAKISKTVFMLYTYIHTTLHTGPPNLQDNVMFRAWGPFGQASFSRTKWLQKRLEQTPSSVSRILQGMPCSVQVEASSPQDRQAMRTLLTQHCADRCELQVR